MAFRTLMTTLALTAALAAPAGAQDHDDHHRSNDTHKKQDDHARQRPQAAAEQHPQAQQQAQPQRQVQPQQTQPQRQAQPQPRQEVRPQEQARQDRAVPRQQAPTVVERHNDNTRTYVTHGDTHAYGWDNHRYESYVHGVHRYNAYVVHPQVIRVVPYQPYVYRPSFSIGVYYGVDGYYPYGATPPGYFSPIAGHAYGGVRLTGAPRDAQVFADGYFVGIVDDFDGIFQHLNLEAGPHHIEIAWGGYQPIAFDVFVRPGETTTFRADGYFRY
jgi:hypothetical protein